MFDWHLFNYTDFNKINLDWITDCLKALLGGSTNQILSKKSDNDFDFEWVNKPEVTPGTGLTEEIKQALLQLAQKVAYIDDQGQTYYQDLYDALYNEAPPVTLVSIDAVYTQSGTVYDTDTLNSLKADLVVTATYSDSSTAIIPAADYTLTGALTVGSSVITVSYGGKTDTFTVAVTESPAPPVTLVSIEAVYTQSGTVYDTDTLNSLKADLVVTATYSDSTTALIPAADYTLTGTLTVGSSVITVSYGGKTDTFTVTVSAHTEYTWLYKSSDGVLLSAETDLVSNTLTNGSPTETIQDGLLHLVAKGTAGAYEQYNLIPNTNTDAVLEAKVRCNSLPAFVNLACGLILMVSNGTAGARLSVDSGGFRYSEGASYTKVDFPTGFDYTEWHIYKVELTSDGKQIGYVDDVKIFETGTLSTQYATVTRIGIVKNNTITQFDVDIEWISFLDRSAT